MLFTDGQIARVCHEANRAYCLDQGDASQPAWDDAPEWQKASAIDGVRYHRANPNSTPADSHRNWFALKKADGWKYGLEKDPEKKLHPCMVDFYELPPAQMVKDYLFVSIVRTLDGAKALG